MHTKWLWDIMPCELRLDDPEGTVLLRCVHTHEPSDDIKRLIAEAPNLLQELEDGLDVMCYACRVHNPQHADCTWCGDTDSWRKAIRKAKGD